MIKLKGFSDASLLLIITEAVFIPLLLGLNITLNCRLSVGFIFALILFSKLKSNVFPVKEILVMSNTSFPVFLMVKVLVISLSDAGSMLPK